MPQAPAAVTIPAPPPTDDHFHRYIAALFAANAGDAGSTEWAVRQGGQEQNPLMQGGTAGRLAVKGGLTAGQALALAYLHKHHPEAAKWLSVALTAVPTALTASNIYQGEKAKNGRK